MKAHVRSVKYAVSKLFYATLSDIGKYHFVHFVRS